MHWFRGLQNISDISTNRSESAIPVDGHFAGAMGFMGYLVCLFDLSISGKGSPDRTPL